MAKQRQRKEVRARKFDEPGEEDSLLVRSAESLGRVIGTLQRQLRVVQPAGRDEGATTTRKTSRSRTARPGKKAAARKPLARRAASTKSVKHAQPARKPRATTT